MKIPSNHVIIIRVTSDVLYTCIASLVARFSSIPFDEYFAEFFHSFTLIKYKNRS